jgi:CRP-like cAMP-binding protein
MLGTCEPIIYPLYIKIGMRPIGKMHNSEKGGYRIPLIAYMDVEHFRKISSPAYRIFAGADETPFKPIKEWHKRFLSNGFDENEIGIDFYKPRDGDLELYGSLIDGISLRGVSRLLRNSLHIKCRKGDVIIPDQDGGKFMGLVYKGSVNIDKESRHLATLNRGELFGELAVIRNDYRTARVSAGSDDTELLILDKKALSMPSAEDALIIWKNLATILAERLLAMNS